MRFQLGREAFSDQNSTLLTHPVAGRNVHTLAGRTPMAENYVGTPFE